MVSGAAEVGIAVAAYERVLVVEDVYLLEKVGRLELDAIEEFEGAREERRVPCRRREDVLGDSARAV